MNRAWKWYLCAKLWPNRLKTNRQNLGFPSRTSCFWITHHFKGFGWSRYVYILILSYPPGPTYSIVFGFSLGICLHMLPSHPVSNYIGLKIQDSRIRKTSWIESLESWIQIGWIQIVLSEPWILNRQAGFKKLFLDLESWIQLGWIEGFFFEPWILDLNSRQLRLKKFFRHCVPIEWGIPRKYSLLPQTFPDRPRTDKPRNLHFWEMVGYFFQNVTLLLHFFAVEWFNRCSSCTLKKSYLPNFLEWMQYSLKEYRTYCIK